MSSQANVNKELFARQQMLKQKFRTFTKYTSDAAHLDYALDLIVDERAASSSSSASPSQSQVQSSAPVADTATAATSSQSQSWCASHEESVDRFVHFVLHAIKGHARALCFSGRATAGGGRFSFVEHANANANVNASPSTATSGSTPTPSEQPGDGSGRGRNRSASPKRAEAQPFIGPMPKPVSLGAGAITFSEVCSGDFVLDEILHHAHRFQLAFADTYRSSTGEFGMLCAHCKFTCPNKLKNSYDYYSIY